MSGQMHPHNYNLFHAMGTYYTVHCTITLYSPPGLCQWGSPIPDLSRPLNNLIRPLLHHNFEQNKKDSCTRTKWREKGPKSHDTRQSM